MVYTKRWSLVLGSGELNGVRISLRCGFVCKQITNTKREVKLRHQGVVGIVTLQKPDVEESLALTTAKRND